MTRSPRPPALALACAGAFLAFLDTTVANLAMPSIADTFDVEVAGLSWVANAYVITFAAFLAPAGALADAVGRARLFVTGVGTFTLASLAIAVAPTFGLLVAFRAVQGVGAALMVPASLSLVLTSVPAAKVRGAIGLWSAAGALAAAIGPALGGVAVEVVDWRALFCLNVPVGVWVLVAARGLLADDSRHGRVPDLAGSVMLGAAVAAAVYGLTQGPERGWGSGPVLLTFAVAVVAAVAVRVRSAHHPRPALRLDLWRIPELKATTIVSVGYGASLFTTMLLGVLFLVDVWQYSTLEAGLAVTPAAVTTAVVGVAVGRLSARVTPRVMIVVGSVVVAATTAVIAGAIDPDPAFLTLWLPTGLVMGVGVGLTTVGISSAAAAAAPPVHFTAATGLVMAARQLGGAFGIAMLAVLLSEVDTGDRVTPYAAVYWFATGVSVAAALVGTLVGPTRTTTSTPAEPSMAGDR